MRISVIVPSYNRADTLSETLDSILAQQVNAELEIIIGDDCSTDNARDVILGYHRLHPETVRYFFWKENLGLGSNWLSCLKQCTGDYVCNCDNDDYWHNPQKLQLQLDYMEEHPEVDMCHTDYRTKNRITGVVKEIVCHSVALEGEDQQMAVMNGHFVCCNATVMYRKEALAKYLPVDDMISRHFTLQDFPVWMILAAHAPFGEIHVSTVTWGMETDSITRPKSLQVLKERMEKERNCYKYICELFPEKFPYIEEEYNDFCFARYLSCAYKERSFIEANYYANQLGNNISKSEKRKKRMAMHRVTFYAYLFVDRIRHWLFNR